MNERLSGSQSLCTSSIALATRISADKACGTDFSGRTRLNQVNLGIEFGQLLVLLLLVPALTWLSRVQPEKSVPQALSALILVVSAMLLLQRL